MSVRQNKDIKNNFNKINLNKIDYNRIYAERDNKKDFFLFLDFWSFMNYQEFSVSVIRDSLLRTKNLRKTIIKMDTAFIYTLELESDLHKPNNAEISFILEPYFEEKNLLSISLEYNDVENFWTPDNNKLIKMTGCSAGARPHL